MVGIQLRRARREKEEMEPPLPRIEELPVCSFFAGKMAIYDNKDWSPHVRDRAPENPVE